MKECGTMKQRKKAMGKDVEKSLEWRKANTKRYEFYLHKELNRIAYEHLESQPNKREYLIRLITEDAKKEEAI